MLNGLHVWDAKVLMWLGHQPVILLFLVVAAGYALGRLKIKGVGLGATASTLVIALAISLLDSLLGVKIEIPELASTIFFDLFMFSVGMKVGPQFLSGLKRDAAKFIFFGLFIPFASIGLMLAMRALMPLGPGLLPGILAGSNTATPGLGAAQAAYAAAGAGKAEALGNLSTAFAFSYCLSMVLFVVFMKLPDVFGRDTAKAAHELEEKIRGPLTSPLPGSGNEFLGGPLPVSLRSYRLEVSRPVGHELGDLRRSHPLVAIERVLRNGRMLDPTDDVVLEPHDTLAVYAPIARHVNAAAAIGPEVDVPELRDVDRGTVDVVVQQPSAADHSLQELAEGIGHGLYLNAMFRGGVEIPHGADTVVERGDVLRVTGSAWRIKSLERTIGKVVRPSVSTDLVTLALGLAAGTAIGAITIPIGALKLTVGAAVGLLLVGIVLSIVRTRQPGFGGPFPEQARQLLEDLGLNVFIAVLGLNAGHGVLKAVGAGALGPILVGTFVVGFVPAIVAWLIGAYAFKMNDALLLGAVAGGRCNSAGMRAAQETTHSTVPAISYPVTFALSNVVLTVMTYVFAMLG
jgi:putative transport protein